METILAITVIILAGALVGLFFYKQGSKPEDQNIHKRLDDLSQNMTNNLNTVTKNVLQQLNNVTEQVNKGLKENNTTLERQHRAVGERLDTAAKAVNTVTSRLSKIEEGNKRIYDVGKDISSVRVYNVYYIF